MSRIFVIHAQPATRRAMTFALRDVPGLELLGHTASAAMATRIVSGLRPDVITVDARLPDGDGIALAHGLRAVQPGLAAIVLGPAEDHRLVLRALDAGMVAYLPNTASSDEIIAALRHAARPNASFSSRCLGGVIHTARPRRDRPTLSRREREVLALLRDGSSAAGIARRLSISESTVKTYLVRIQDKLQPADRAVRRLRADEHDQPPVSGGISP